MIEEVQTETEVKSPMMKSNIERSIEDKGVTYLAQFYMLPKCWSL